jgi:integrase
LERTTVRRILARAMKTAKLNGADKPKLTIHGLRHVFASMLIAMPESDPVRVSKQLGHANPNITLGIYAHLFEQRRYAESARAGLDAAFGKVLEGRR